MINHPLVKRRSQRGFTLIELLTIVSILGLLAWIGLSGFKVYKASGYYTVAESFIVNARTALEAAINDVDDPPGAVLPLVREDQQGAIQDPAAAKLLRGMKMPRLLVLQISYDPTCDNSACQSEFMQVNHCRGEEFTQWIRHGDGVEFFFQNITGGGCP